MNEKHYPSLELCKKLKEIGFPNTKSVIYEEFSEDDGCIYPTIWYRNPFNVDSGFPCPSVMEMLAVIPRNIGAPPNRGSFMASHDVSMYHVFRNDANDEYNLVEFPFVPLPDALASMVLWLHENKHISFT